LDYSHVLPPFPLPNRTIFSFQAPLARPKSLAVTLFLVPHPLCLIDDHTLLLMISADFPAPMAPFALLYQHSSSRGSPAFPAVGPRSIFPPSPAPFPPLSLHPGQNHRAFLDPSALIFFAVIPTTGWLALTLPHVPRSFPIVLTPNISPYDSKESQ